MLSSVAAKAVRDRGLVTLVVAFVLVFFAAFSMGIYASFGEEAFRLIDDLPDAIAAMYGTNDGTPAGLVTGALFSLMAPLMVLAYGISGATSAVIGEEKDKTLDLLLSNPVSRTRVLTAKVMVLALGIATICIILWGGSELVSNVVGLDTQNQDLFAASLQLLGLGLMFAALALALGSWFSGTIAAGITGALAAVSYLATSLFPIDPTLEPFAKFTPWYLYSGNDPLHNGVGWWGLLAMVTLSGALFTIALVGFNKRDLRG